MRTGASFPKYTNSARGGSGFAGSEFRPPHQKYLSASEPSSSAAYGAFQSSLTSRYSSLQDRRRRSWKWPLEGPKSPNHRNERRVDHHIILTTRFSRPSILRSIDRSIPGILNDGTRRNHHHTARVGGFFQSHDWEEGIAGRAPTHRLAERARAGLPAESSDTTRGRGDLDVDVDVDVDRFRLGRYGDLQAAADDVLAGRARARHSHVPGASLSLSCCLNCCLSCCLSRCPSRCSAWPPRRCSAWPPRRCPSCYRLLCGLCRSFRSLSQDAAYSGDWSRIGVISTETERFLQTFCVFGVAIHALLGVAAAKISMDRGERNWWVRGLKTVRQSRPFAHVAPSKLTRRHVSPPSLSSG